MSYVKLKNGCVMAIWSDNIEDGTMDGFPYDKDFDSEVDTLETWSTSEVYRVFDHVKDIRALCQSDQQN